MLVGLSTTSLQFITSTINRNNREIFVAFLRFCARKLVWPSDCFMVFLSHSRKVSDDKISPMHITHSDQYSRSWWHPFRLNINNTDEQPNQTIQYSTTTFHAVLHSFKSRSLNAFYRSQTPTIVLRKS